MNKRETKISSKENVGEWLINVGEWLINADEDFQMAQLCYENKKYLHCAFLCQQAIEKAIKAKIAAGGEIPYPIHDLTALAEDAGVWNVLVSEQKHFLMALTVYAINARYPERKKKLFSVCKEKEAKEILELSKEMILWLKEKTNERLSQEK